MKVRVWLVAVATGCVIGVLCAAAAYLKHPCRLLEPDESTKKLVFAGGSGGAVHPEWGLSTCKVFCRLNALLTGEGNDERLAELFTVVPDREHHRTYYVFSPRHEVDAAFIVYSVEDGTVMPQGKFYGGGGA